MESDEECKRKSKRAAKKVKVEGESVDEGAEAKKKRGGGKLKRPSAGMAITGSSLVMMKPAKKVRHSDLAGL
jgi:hypothetical protein